MLFSSLFTSTVLWLTGLFVFNVLLLLCALIYNRIHWILKSLLVMMSAGAFLSIYVGMVTVSGWPLAIEDVGKVRFLAVIIDEPYRDSPGAIYLWAQPVDLAKHTIGDPRNFVIPFSKETEEKLLKAQKAVGNGLSVYLDIGPETKFAGKGARNPYNYHAQVVAEDLIFPDQPPKE